MSGKRSLMYNTGRRSGACESIQCKHLWLLTRHCPRFSGRYKDECDCNPALRTDNLWRRHTHDYRDTHQILTIVISVVEYMGHFSPCFCLPMIFNFFYYEPALFKVGKIKKFQIQIWSKWTDLQQKYQTIKAQEAEASVERWAVLHTSNALGHHSYTGQGNKYSK